MRRFPPRGFPPRQPPGRGGREPVRREGPFDRILRPKPGRDPAPFIIGGTVFFVALVVLILFVAPFSPLAEEDRVEEVPAGEVVARRQKEVPPLPPGLIAVSPFYAIDVPEGVSGPAVITVQLLQAVGDPTNLGFYTFGEGRWRQVATASLGRDGSEASGEFPVIPENLAVLRVIAPTYQVVASLPAGATLHPDAQALLNIVSPRDYVPESDGAITGEATPLEVGQEVPVIPTIVASDDLGAAAVADILSAANASQAHIDNIVELVTAGDFDGIDLEYSISDPQLKPAFTQFVEALAQRLHQQGRRLSLTLPAATAAEEAASYDWQALGALVDMIKILPPADPAGYWDDMPDALSFAVQNVDPEKLFLVVSPFARRRAGTGHSAIGYQQAMLLATQMRVRSPSNQEEIRPGRDVDISAINIDGGEGASGLQWSDDARSIVFSFGQEPNRTTVFVENAFSVAFKLELVQIFRLAGVAVADASAEADVANIWPAVQALVDTGTAVLIRPNPDNLSPQWFAPDGGDIEARNGAALWRPLAAGPHTIELVISDGVLRFGRRLDIEVMEAEVATPTPTPTPEELPPELETPTPSPTPSPTPTPTPTPAPNNPPVAINVDMGVSKNSSGNPWTPVVSDPDGDPLTCGTSGTSEKGGTVSVNSDCSTGTYTPATDFEGVDSFSYTVSDGELAATATVTVTVTP